MPTSSVDPQGWMSTRGSPFEELISRVDVVESASRTSARLEGRTPDQGVLRYISRSFVEPVSAKFWVTWV